MLIHHYIEQADSIIELGKLLSLGNGFAFRSNTYVDCGPYKVLTIKNVQDGNVDCTDSEYVEDLPVKMKPFCRLKVGDVVLSLTGNVGRVGIVSEENCLLNQRVAVFQPKNLDWLPWLYFWFRQQSFKNSLIGIAKGTAQTNLSPIETLGLKIPFNQKTIIEMSANCMMLFECILANKKEARCLSEFRNTILPKLMSGEIDVSQIELGC